MTNYFNEQTRKKHIVICAMQQVCDEMTESRSITDEERKYLRMAKAFIQKFNKSVFERFGEPYQRKVENTMQVNELGFYSKFAEKKDCIGYCATNDIAPKVADLQFLHCMECERKDYKDCAVYALSVSCGTEPQDENDFGCPFRIF